MKKAKYKDKLSLISYSKQIEKSFDKSSRQIRREWKREMEKFSHKMISLTSREWWESMKSDDQDSIRRDYLSNCDVFGFGLDNWIRKVKEKWKPDPVKYRDTIIDILLDGDN
jgi:hypothetical protein